MYTKGGNNDKGRSFLEVHFCIAHGFIKTKQSEKKGEIYIELDIEQYICEGKSTLSSMQNGTDECSLTTRNSEERGEVV